MKIKAIVADEYLNILNQMFMDNHKGKLGYAIMYNRRKIQEELKEYLEIKNQLIIDCGKPQENGTYVIDKDDTDAVNKFVEGIETYANIEHDITFMCVEAEEIWDELTSSEMERISFMITDKEIGD